MSYNRYNSYNPFISYKLWGPSKATLTPWPLLLGPNPKMCVGDNVFDWINLRWWLKSNRRAWFFYGL